MPAADPGRVDAIVERAGRWTARRLTRRSFIARAGQAAMAVAGGAAMTTLMADPAGARVCGQTGVSLQCPDFDCPDGVWGWCWYATGCCAGGYLKKICDCCVTNYPNVHGYCPAGTNVKCIVESCDEDPRLQQVPITKVITDDSGVVAARIRAHRFKQPHDYVLIGDGQDPLFAAVNTAFGNAYFVPMLLVGRTRLSPGAIAEAKRLGALNALIVSPTLPAEVDDQLATAGLTPLRLATSTQVGPLSGELARVARERLTLQSTVFVGPDDAPALAPLAAAFASVVGAPLVFGIENVRTELPIYLVGPQASLHANAFNTAVPFPQRDVVDLSTDLATAALSSPRFDGTIVFSPRDSRVQVNFAALGAPMLVHDPNSVDRLSGWITRNRRAIRSVWLGGHAGSLGSPAYRKLQSLLNGFEIDRLQGVAGQGLPVYSQPLPERAIGAARRGTDPPPARFSSRTWGQSGQPEG